MDGLSVPVIVAAIDDMRVAVLMAKGTTMLAGNSCSLFAVTVRLIE